MRALVARWSWSTAIQRTAVLQMNRDGWRRPHLRRGALVLLGTGDLGHQLLAACQPQWGSSSMARASATMSALPSAMMVSACLGVAISPTVRVAMPTSRFTFSANSTLVSPLEVDVSALMPPGGDADEIEADRLQCFRERNGIVGGEPAFAPKRFPPGDPRPRRTCLWRMAPPAELARRTCDPESACAPQSGPPAIVLARLESGGGGLCEKIAVGPMEFDGVDAGANRARLQSHRARAPCRRRHLLGSSPLEQRGRCCGSRTMATILLSRPSA